MTQHAKLSASGASRWLACTPSVRLEENYENTTSIYAEEGTFAHEYGELLLSLEYDYIKKRSFNTKLKKLKENEFYSKELEDYIHSYADSVIEIEKVQTELDTIELTGNKVTIEDTDNNFISGTVEGALKELAVETRALNTEVYGQRLRAIDALNSLESKL